MTAAATDHPTTNDTTPAATDHPTTDDTTPAADQPDTAQPGTDAPTVKDRAKKSASSAVDAAARWRGFVLRPMTPRQVWEEACQIDVRRVPEKSDLVGWMWWLSNRTDLLMLFCILLLLRTLLGLVAWCAPRPTRRWGLYLVVILVFVVVPAIAAVT